MIVNHLERVDGSYLVERREEPDPPSQRKLGWSDTDADWYEGPYFDTCDAKVMLGHHACEFCGADVDFPGQCPACARVIDWPQPGYEDFDRTVGF